jgi:hypothetical protein
MSVRSGGPEGASTLVGRLEEGANKYPKKSARMRTFFGTESFIRSPNVSALYRERR